MNRQPFISNPRNRGKSHLHYQTTKQDIRTLTVFRTVTETQIIVTELEDYKDKDGWRRIRRREEEEYEDEKYEEYEGEEKYQEEDQIGRRKRKRN